MTSTRKTSFGPVQNAINKAAETKLLVRHWNALDVTERCPASRHRPDLPKVPIYWSYELVSAVSEENYNALPAKDQRLYTKDTACWGCLNNCSLFAACRGNLIDKQTSTSTFLKPISYQINQFKDSPIDIVQSELLCRKPASEGLIYPRLDKDKHMLTPAQAYEKIFGEPCTNKNLSKDEFIRCVEGMGEWCAGMDFGWSHFWAYSQGIDINNCMYVTHAFAGAELERSQQLEEMEKYRRFDPVIWPDKEDPMAIKDFKKAGFRLKDWNKNQGSVVGGINVVRKKLNPPLGKSPELYFVRDIGEDPHMDLLFLHLSEHHWKLDATGNITNNVSDNNKDLPDSLRYLVMNKYATGSKLTVATSPEPKTTPIDKDGQRVYNVNTWAQSKIAELTGQEIQPPKTTRPAMTVQDISPGKSYYTQEEDEEEKKRRVGKKRGISWDFS